MEHREVHASSPEYSILAPSFRPLLGGPSVTQHIHFGAHTSNVFGAPFTEFAFFKVKQDQSKDELHSLLKGMCTSIDRLFSKMYAPCGLGESVENPGTFCLVVGWNTIAVSDLSRGSCVLMSHGPYPTQDHIEVVNRKDSAALMAKITKLSDVDVRHVPLKRFSGETKELLNGLQSKL